MNYQDFKPLAIGLLSQSSMTTTDVWHSLSYPKTLSTINEWLGKMIKEGILVRGKDPSFKEGFRYLYSLVARKEEPAQIKTAIDCNWRLLLSNLASPLSVPLLRAYGKPIRIGKDTVIEMENQKLIKVAKGKAGDIRNALATSFGGDASDYEVTFVAPCEESGVAKQDTPVVDITANEVNPDSILKPVATTPSVQEVEKEVPSFDNSIPAEIKSEFSVKPDGITTVTLRGASRLLGINHKTLSDHFSGRQNTSKLAEILSSKGFDVGGFASQGIPDVAFDLIAKYYAYKAGRYCTSQAEAVCEAFGAIGVRTWIQSELGWNPVQSAIVRNPDPLTDNLNALVVSIQGLAQSAQSQQAMIRDQQSAMREVIAGLNQIGQSIHVHGQKIHEHENKIVSLESYIEQREAERQLAMKSVFGVKPTVEAPPKDFRAQLIHLVNNYVFAKGLGKDGHGKTWAHLYRDIELRCHVSLQAECKKLIANGQKDVKKIDAIESLGLMETAVAIACEVLEVA